MTNNYWCSKCKDTDDDEFTVSKDIDFRVPGMEYSEVMYNIYTCEKCHDEAEIRSTEDYTSEGSIIFMD